MKIFKSLALSAVALVGFVAYTGTANADEINYTIKANDTLSSIAQEYFGSSDYVNRIATDNNISNINLIYVGETLVLNTDASATVAQTTATAASTSQAATTQATQTTQTTTQSTTTYSSTATGSEAEAKEWIANKESGGSYTATNGQYIGRYQLTSSYLNGDYSAANQEKVANAYVLSRYGSWTAAKAFWLANGWY
ncbi:LysM peptidoglycan-binding domain-containing protein [Enterococcus italicus]|uniref:LysM domain protein n=1 Tax=Enterococcus italicus (strain DSM 15952 / CCUG 50447 / LMG 22039 / TP 1.5) TaxID=888064 RepID=E6LGG6_ENTI1|nr:LysM domain-containing protein [Enterococcus italicus]EFU73730.1 LysM domain protein [Enterococcus italicus DSM 15952]OJG59149.1 peptidase M23B [Enterococcus italicus DSM 15952]